MKTLLLISISIGLASAGIKWIPCTDEKCSGTITSLTISDCAQTPCTFRKGSNYTLDIDFTTTAVSKNLESKIAGQIEGIWVPFPFSQEEVCQDKQCDLKCPIAAGGKFHYTASLPVKSVYPEIELIVKWAMYDPDAKEDVWCFEVPVRIVGSKDPSEIAMPRSVEKLHL